MFKGKITVVGAGFVGSTTAYTIMMGGIASEIILIDLNKDKAEGDAMDMSHGVSFVNPVQIVSGDYSAAEGSDLVIITAGVSQKPGETRTDLLSRNIAVFKNIISEITKYCKNDTLLLIVTNPVDVLSYVTYKLSGFDKSKVIGSGTVLDTSRLKYLIGRHTGVDTRNVHTYIIGEHGETEVAAWSATSIAGMTLEEYCGSCGGCEQYKRDGVGAWYKDEVYNQVKNAAHEIIVKKGATYYAVALAVRRIVECMAGDENSILTVSTLMEGHYGINDVYLSVPTIVNSDGVSKTLEVAFAPDEINNLRKSADAMKSFIKEAGF